MKNLGAAMVGGNGKRRADDFYPTPPEATEALCLAGLLDPAMKDAWEPACGDGAMARVLLRHGYEVVATDLVDRGFGHVQDFLKTTAPLADTIITNPPFNLAEAFIRHANEIGTSQIAMLLKSTFWHAAKRIPLFNKYPPAVIAPLTWRLDFTGGGAPTMDCVWVVWGGPMEQGVTVFHPLPRPASMLNELMA